MLIMNLTLLEILEIENGYASDETIDLEFYTIDIYFEKYEKEVVLRNKNESSKYYVAKWMTGNFNSKQIVELVESTIKLLDKNKGDLDIFMSNIKL